MTDPLPHGVYRPRTEPRCGDIHNGFSTVMNWGRLSPGEKTLTLFVNGVERVKRNFFVTTFGGEYVEDAGGMCTVPNLRGRARRHLCVATGESGLSVTRVAELALSPGRNGAATGQPAPRLPFALSHQRNQRTYSRSPPDLHSCSVSESGEGRRSKASDRHLCQFTRARDHLFHAKVRSTLLINFTPSSRVMSRDRTFALCGRTQPITLLSHRNSRKS